MTPLIVEVEGRALRFEDDRTVRIGSAPDSDVVLTAEPVAPHHAVVSPVAGNWILTNASGSGIYSGGRRIPQTRVAEPMAIRLGHPTKAPELVLSAAASAAGGGPVDAPRRGAVRTLGLVAAVLVLIGGAAAGALWFLDRDRAGQATARDAGRAAEPAPDEPAAGGSVDTPQELTPEERAATEEATVLLSYESTLATEPRVRVTGQGTGALISADGLILTSARVATPGAGAVVSAYGTPAWQIVADPDYFTVSMADPVSGAVEARYRAEVVSAAGRRNVAVLRITADQDGNPVEPGELDLPYVERGDSDQLGVDDAVTIVGFTAPEGADPGDPDAPYLPTITATEARILDVRSRSWSFDTDAAVSPTEHGGLAVDNDGRLIGVPIQGDAVAGVSSRVRMINVADDLIEEAEDAVD